VRGTLFNIMKTSSNRGFLFGFLAVLFVGVAKILLLCRKPGGC